MIQQPADVACVCPQVILLAGHPGCRVGVPGGLTHWHENALRGGTCWLGLLFDFEFLTRARLGQVCSEHSFPHWGGLQSAHRNRALRVKCHTARGYFETCGICSIASQIPLRGHLPTPPLWQGFSGQGVVTVPARPQPAQPTRARSCTPGHRVLASSSRGSQRQRAPQD